MKLHTKMPMDRVQGKGKGTLALVGFVLMLTFIGSAFGQSGEAGKLVGRVLDQSSSVVSGASLKLEDQATSATYTATSEADGGFVFPILPSGLYRLTVTSKGFKTAVYRDIKVDAARASNITAKLEIGEVEQSIQVEAGAPVLETTSNTISTVVTTKELQDLPLNGRDVLKFITLTPGYIRGPGDYNGSRSGNEVYDATFNNYTGSALRVTLDGITNQSQAMRDNGIGNTLGATARLENIEEVTVSTSQVGGNNGGQGTAVVQFVTKRGGNGFHGQAFWQHRNAALNANDWRNNAVDLPIGKFIMNDFGASVGGPILRDRLFFFVNYSENIQPTVATTQRTILTPEAMTGVFRYVGTDGVQRTVNVLQMAAANGFPSAVNPFMADAFQKINAALPLGVTVPTTNLFNMRYLFNWEQRLNTKYPAIKLDWNVSNKIRAYASLNYTRTDNKRTTTPQYPTFTEQIGGSTGNRFVATPGFTWTISPSMVNDFKVGWVGLQGNFSVGAKPVDISKPLVVDCAGLCDTGIVPTLPQASNSKIFNIVDNFNYNRGTHSITIGGSFQTNDETFLSPMGGIARYFLGVDAGVDPVAAIFNTATIPNLNPNAIGDARSLYAALTGRILRIDSAQPNHFDEKSGTYVPGIQGRWGNKQKFGGVYFQDSWRVKPGLTVNYGLRWDFYGDMYHHPLTYSGPSVEDLWGPSGVENIFKPGTLTGSMNPMINVQPHIFKPSYVNPSHNVGIAWSLPKGGGWLGRTLGDGKTVIRAGYADTYFTYGIQNYDNIGSGLFNWQNFGLTNGQNGFVPGNRNLGEPLPPFVPSPESFSFPQPVSNFTFLGRLLTTINPNIKSPHSRQWSFGIQREIVKNGVFEIRYVGNRTVDGWLSKEINEVNIFENGFLKEFRDAQKNLTIFRGATPNCGAAGQPACNFGNSGLPGQVNLPIFTAAFQASGPGRPAVTNGFTNAGFVNNLTLGRAGAAANGIAGNLNFFCRMVGASFAPCAARNYTGPATYPINFFQANPFNSGSRVYYLDNLARTNYNALQLEFRHRYSRGLSLGMNYTFGKGLANGGNGAIYREQFQGQHQFTTNRDIDQDYGPTDFDVRHAFSFSGTYDLPFGRGKKLLSQSRLLDVFVGAWTLGSIVQIQSGTPFRLTSGSQTVNTNDSGVVLSGISRKELQNSVGVFSGSGPFVTLIDPKLLGPDGRPNPALFTAPSTPGEFGEYIYLYGPKFVSADFAATKRFTITERVKAAFQAEFLNAFNHPSFVLTGFGNVNLSVTSATFGQQTRTAHAPRQIQFRLQFEF
jgi:carboxypeptidase family protein